MKGKINSDNSSSATPRGSATRKMPLAHFETRPLSQRSEFTVFALQFVHCPCTNRRIGACRSRIGGRRKKALHTML